MSGTTFTWTGANSSDWNTDGNWNNGTAVATGVPNTSTAIAIDNIGSISSIIDGGKTDSVASVSIGGTGHVVISGAPLPGLGEGDGAGGTLTSAGTIDITSTNIGGGLVGGPAAQVTAPTISLGAGAVLGGGGTFNVASFLNSGEIQADGGNFGLGTLVVTGGSITGTGTLLINSNTVTGAGPISALELGSATGQAVTFQNDPGHTTQLFLDNPSTFKGSFNFDATNNPTSADLFVKGTVTNAALTNIGNNTGTLVVSNGATTVDSIPVTPNGTIAVQLDPTSSVAGYSEIAIVCYARGTRIATPEGERAVESLDPGDLLLTANGDSAPVKWIGRRRVDCRKHPQPKQVWPVRIKAGAFAPSIPARDLLVSPQHAIFAEGVLIPARYLVNGTTIVQDRPDSMEYFHVELERHDLLLAEGLAAESYLDTGDRAAFENAGGAMILHPDFSRWAWDAGACAELKVTGPEFDAVTAKLASRAAELAGRGDTEYAAAS